MTIEDLFKTRQSIYYKNLSKYLKYVLNDHFVILLLVLGGATGLAYQSYIGTLHSYAFFPRVILAAVSALAIFSGSIRTLVEPADAVFLLPKEKAFDSIMKKNLLSSMVFHSLYTVLLGILSVPLLTAIDYITPDMQIFWIATLICWKLTHVIHIYFQLRQHQIEKGRVIRTVAGTLTLSGLVISLFVSLSAGFILSVMTLVIIAFFVFQHTRLENWNWEKLIETEQKRTQKIYSIINMFIETPYSRHKVKRLKVLDVFYHIPVLSQGPEIYYLSRLFIRNYNFSGLYLRLVLIGSIAIYFTENWIINSLVSVLFLYLIGFQLVPLKQTFSKAVFFRLYPNADIDKISTIQKLLLILLGIGALAYSLSASSSGWLMLVRVLILNSAFIWLFVYGYLPRRLNK